MNWVRIMLFFVFALCCFLFVRIMLFFVSHRLMLLRFRGYSGLGYVLVCFLLV